MAAPAPSHLDASQVLQGAFDESTGSLRVETNLSTVLVGGSQIIEITDAQDAIKIGDGNGNYAGVTNSGLNSSLIPLQQFQTSQYTIGTSSVQLTSTPLSNRKSVCIKSAGSVYIGNSSAVTTSTGFFLNNGESISMDLDGSHSLYAISNTTSQKIFVLELA